MIRLLFGEASMLSVLRTAVRRCAVGATSSCFLASAFVTGAVAQSTTEDKIIDRVVVTAAGFEQKIVDAPASITVVGVEELAKRPYTSLLDALRDI
jgi:outer membrane receptor for ferrienterochelin and colicins